VNLALDALITGRETSLLQQDFEQAREALQQQLAGKNVLVIGGAGTIGSAVVSQLAGFGLRKLDVLDLSENNLAELVRDLRSSGLADGPQTLRTLPIDFGSSIMQRLLRESEPYDACLSLAALKHVRSEKDPYSLLRMLKTNILDVAQLLGWLREAGCPRFFSVSTDKAACPVNLMGASKHLMEHVMFTQASGMHSTTLRSGNVAFSDGSLLHGILHRLRKNQPVAVPRGVRRYFLSATETAQACLLAAFRIPVRHILIPRLDPERHMLSLQEVAERILAHHGLTPKAFTDEQAARDAAGTRAPDAPYPLLLTTPDTSGEKLFEEFVMPSEQTVDLGLKGATAIPYIPLAGDQSLISTLETLQALVEDPTAPVAKEQLVALLSGAIPGFAHIETGKNLDQRM